MPYIYVKDFAQGLDTRRMEVNTPGGALLELTNAHINRGGEIEGRKAFVPLYNVAGTVGLAAIPTAVVVFGVGDQPANLPPGVVYERLNISTSADLVRILSWDLYDSKLYVVAQFSDNAIHHFYDGVEVGDWYNGRASTTVRFLTAHDGAYGKGSFLVVGGTNVPGVNMVTQVFVAGVPLLASPVDCATTTAATASLIANRINVDGVQNAYVASAVDNQVIIQTVDATDDANGRQITVNVAGDAAVGQLMPIAGGVEPSSVDSIRINGVEALGTSVPYPNGGTLSDFVEAVADRINAQPSDPDYEAEANVTSLLIRPADVGAKFNGYQVAISATDVSWTPSIPVLAGGADTGLQPGTYVKTIKTKVYATSGSNLHFSGIDQPTKWTTDVTGAGFINMSKQASGSEDLSALATYQNNVAVFAPRTIQVWYLDADPDQSQQVQVLKNTGTSAPLSVTTFGDQDVFYLDESGIRSLQARNSSNAAFASDIGNPVDTLVQQIRQEIGDSWRDKAIGLIEPLDGRFWLIMQATIFVFSYFTNSKISAWSIYHPGYQVEYAAVFNNRVYIRAGDGISCYGGLSGNEYDDTAPVARLPFLDAGDPGTKKRVVGIDCSCVGTWDVQLSTDPNFPQASDLIGTVFESTFALEKVPAVGESTHFSLTFSSHGDAEPPKLGSVLIHYMKGVQEANG